MEETIRWIGGHTGWVTSAFLMAVLTWVTSNRWEVRKLARTERSKAYGAMLDSCSRWWSAFSARDRCRKNGDTAGVEAANDEVWRCREASYSAYADIQIVGSARVIRDAYALLTLHDYRNRAFHEGTPGVPQDERARYLAAFVASARKDLRLSRLKPMDLKKVKYQPK